MLTNEQGTASNIKSRTNRQSVISAIVKTKQLLKTYNKIPDTGLCIFCGLVTDSLDHTQKTKLILVDIVPKKELGTSLYLCDNKFHISALKSLLKIDDVYGFVVIDGQSTLFGTLSGSSKTVLAEYEVDLPKKHNKGGQSQPRYARIRLEKRHNYITKVSEMVTKYFIKDNIPSIKNIIIAGSAELKQELVDSETFDKRLLSLVSRPLVDIAYGSTTGFSQAITLSKDIISNNKYIYEKNIICNFFSILSRESNLVCFGLKDTLSFLESGLVKDMIIYEDLDLRYKDLDEDLIEYLLSKKEHRFGAKIELISNETPESSQIINGFGGLCAILRYPVNVSELDLDDLDEDQEQFSNDY
jgi:peptide chain release factor subunit 1